MIRLTRQENNSLSLLPLSLVFPVAFGQKNVTFTSKFGRKNVFLPLKYQSEQ